jgi:hypothetical protein
MPKEDAKLEIELNARKPAIKIAERIYGTKAELNIKKRGTKPLFYELIVFILVGK